MLETLGYATIDADLELRHQRLQRKQEFTPSRMCESLLVESFS